MGIKKATAINKINNSLMMMTNNSSCNKKYAHSNINPDIRVFISLWKQRIDNDFS